jgi:hypothetical protein
MLCGISCELAGCVHRPIVDSEAEAKLNLSKLHLSSISLKLPPQVRGSAGEHSEADGGMYDVSNRERMGLTEFQVTPQHNSTRDLNTR